MPNLNLPKLNARVDRARQGLTHRCVYKLGKGGFNAKHPLDPCPDSESDCSGFVSWVLMTQRESKLGRKFWIETTAIFHDAQQGSKVFRQIGTPIPGCLVVYGDSGKRQGHIAVVERVNGKAFDTIECASGTLGSKLVKKAIRRRANAQKVFKPGKAIFCVLNEDFE